MEIWIPITVFAAFSQSIRSALQKHLTAELSAFGATQARFLYAIPFALIYLAALVYGFGYALPDPDSTFLAYAVTGGIAQILGSALLVTLYSHGNFVVGTAYSKTESIQAAALGVLVLSDGLSAGAVIGICLGITGVTVMASAHTGAGFKDTLRSLTSRAALLGLACGFGFAVASIAYRGASLSLEGGVAVQAAFTLAFVLTLQALIVFVYLVLREPGQMTAVLANQRTGWLVGLAGMTASVGWFTAMTLQNAGYVRALGQVELIFAYLLSLLFFRERIARQELAGMLVMVTGIVILLLYSD